MLGARFFRAAKPKRSAGRGGTLLTRVRVTLNYGSGWAGGVTSEKELANFLSISSA